MLQRFGFLVAAFITACASVAQEDRAAVLVEPTAASRAELLQTLRDALSNVSVTIADDALTRDSLLVIERAPARDAAGQRLSGRDFGKPETFQLVLVGQRCMLIQRSTSQRYELRKSRCTALTRLSRFEG